MKRLLLPFVSLLAAGSLGAQTLVLSDFSSFTLAEENYLLSAFGDGQWSNATASGGLEVFTIGDFGAGAPGGAAGNGFALAIGGLPSWTQLATVELTGFAGPTNATPALSLYLEDATDPFNFALTTFDLAAFAGGSTTVSLTVNLGGLDPANIGRWGFVVGEFDNPEFNFTFDNLQLTAIPEPATCAALFGAMALGLVGVRRWRSRRLPPACAVEAWRR